MRKWRTKKLQPWIYAILKLDDNLGDLTLRDLAEAVGQTKNTLNGAFQYHKITPLKQRPVNKYLINTKKYRISILKQQIQEKIISKYNEEEFNFEKK